ncbi:transcriptional regulator [Leuconostoc lactis]|uniref:DUF722 domain-containing protein n=1 Tax=Leuconostoc lactis TaxID=1246 RepID=UPI000BABA5BC|nr:DUF722 domain-containing protein [Leuconostoc lactis]PAV33097.1 transcriptional regulator [Leuconostoc lactis]
MSDRIDNYFSDYYSGVIAMQIATRKNELKLPTVVDENQGGGRAKNKQSRILDDQLIVEESDFILQSFIRDEWVMAQFLRVLTDYEQALLMLKYDRRKKRSWIQVAMILSKSESQCRRDLVNVKKRYRDSTFSQHLVENFM